MACEWARRIQQLLDANAAIGLRFLTLATVRADGSPAARTIVFRGWAAEGSPAATFCTDARSDKAEEIRRNPRAEACWYMGESREQFRIRGLLEVVGADTVEADRQRQRQELWRSISPATKQQFFWPAPKVARREGEGPSQFPDVFPEVPPETFLLLVLVPHEADHLVLGEQTRRWIHTQGPDGTWTKLEVNP